MLDAIKHPAAADPNDITLGELLAIIDTQPDLPLIFHYDGRSVKTGYHVTEVKAGQFGALDCGGNPEAWTEIFVQLWDVDEGGRTHMPSGKFAKIIRKVSDHLGLDARAKLTFEVSDGVAPMQLHRAALPTTVDQQTHIALSPRPASCKPRDRWLEDQKRASSGCSNGANACCG
ncbi:MAG: DUF6428 family protein [Paracoccaceae bacterium]